MVNNSFYGVAFCEERKKRIRMMPADTRYEALLLMILIALMHLWEYHSYKFKDATARMFNNCSDIDVPGIWYCPDCDFCVISYQNIY